MELSKLIFANKNIKRRLAVEFRGDVCKFMDGRGRIVETKPIGIPNCPSVSNLENPFNDERRRDKPYFINLNVSRDKVVDGIITEEEAALILGIDYFSEARPDDINAMLDACTGGPGLANAYVLGGSHSGGNNKDPNFVNIPIQYYSIQKRIYDSLALTEREIRK